ncbi:hypothetical protein SBA4_5260003 [Candidatus Sulfopaludibacter sp. SbA4]|nr:hypothetical protein SBA4_5260003 [Candidatus Sulfopaludibacter sp. SbA4]
MELLPGKTLDKLIGRKRLPAGEVLRNALTLADALAKAHGLRCSSWHRQFGMPAYLVCRKKRVRTNAAASLASTA